MSARLPEDPKELIGQSLAMGEDFPGPAADILLSWMLSLAHGLDAAEAARTLLERYAAAMAAPVANPAAVRLREMLRETAGLAGQPARAGRRRGGWQGRREKG